MLFPRCTYFFECGKAGWSETYHAYGDFPVLRDLKPWAESLGRARAGLLKSPAAITAYRLSYSDTWRDAIMTNLQPFSWEGPVINTAFTVMGIGASLLCRAESGIFNRRSFYLAGAPAFCGNGQKYTPSAQFETRFDLFKVELQEKWGWLATGNDPITYPQKTITGYNAGTSAWTIGAHGFVVGDTVLIHGVTTMTKKFNATGKVLTVVDANNVILTTPAPNNLLLPMTGWARKQVKIVVPYTDRTEVVRVTSRKRGRPFDVPVGRRPTRRVSI